jgi:hypothetical protein
MNFIGYQSVAMAFGTLFNALLIWIIILFIALVWVVPHIPGVPSSYPALFGPEWILNEFIHGWILTMYGIPSPHYSIV